MIKWRNFLTGKDDATVGNVTFLSRPREWHSVMVGFLMGITGQQFAIIALVSYILGRETKLFSLLDELPDSLHKSDAKKEPAYAAGGMVLGLIIHSVLWGVPSYLPV